MRIITIFLLSTWLLVLSCTWEARAQDSDLSTEELAAKIEADRAQADNIAFCFWVGGWAIVGGAVGAAIGDRKGKRLGGFFVGLVLGPIGWIMIAVSKGNRINCPNCRELIDPMANVCPKCHAKLFDENKPLSQERWMAERAAHDDSWKHVTKAYGNESYRQYVASFRAPQAEADRFIHPGALRAENAEAVPPPPKRADNTLIRVARDGEDLGRVTPQKLCDMITAGDLTMQDHYFDSELNQWLTLDACPSISVGE